MWMFAGSGFVRGYACMEYVEYRRFLAVVSASRARIFAICRWE